MVLNKNKLKVFSLVLLLCTLSFGGTIDLSKLAVFFKVPDRGSVNPSPLGERVHLVHESI